MSKDRKRAIVMLSTFPPRECGLAKFAAHLSGAFEASFGDDCDMRVIAMNRDAVSRFRYPSQVDLQINQNDPAEYVRAAEAINRQPHIRLVHIQHEFGIFGGELGAHLLKFTEALTKPFVSTYHTVLPEPEENRRAIIAELSRQAGRVITMTETSKRLLVDDYGVDATKIDIVPHGIIPMPYEDSSRAKSVLGLTGRTVLLTFGLLSRNKGVEYVIQSLPEIVARHHDTVYLIVGATHPEVIAQEGESYRQSLVKMVYDLGLIEHVRFYDEFVSDESLQTFLHAADIYVSTSLDPNQAVSGTLSYAIGSGRPVISTAFAQAKESVASEIGLLVGFRDPHAYVEAVNRLLDDPNNLVRMSGIAFERTRKMTWPNVALQTMRVYASCDSDLDNVRLTPPPFKLDHIRRLTDDFAMLQFSVGNHPDPKSGYAVDDNARALIASVKYFARFHDRSVLELSKTYLGFLGQAGRPVNFSGLFGMDRRLAPSPSPDDNQDDAKGRLIMALAEVAATDGLPVAVAEPNQALLNEWLDAAPDIKSTRSAAFLVIGLVALRRAGSADPRLEPLITKHCDHLASLYESQRSDDWEWFEPCISYSNGAMCEALLAGGRLLNNSRWLNVGRKTLDFLISVTFQDGRYVAIGQRDWCHRGRPRSLFDQQPEDASTMMSALGLMAEIDPAGAYAALRRTTFEWFIGRNTLGQFVYNVATGGCYDGLGEHAVNLNQGAESTVAYLLARLQIQ